MTLKTLVSSIVVDILNSYRNDIPEAEAKRIADEYYEEYREQIHAQVKL